MPAGSSAKENTEENGQNMEIHLRTNIYQAHSRLEVKRHLKALQNKHIWRGLCFPFLFYGMFQTDVLFTFGCLNFKHFKSRAC
ncbi:hypothetical protein FKM82_010535 [Ascaphus truei]